MNSQIAEGKWTELKGEIQKKWGQLTGSELDKAKGDMKAISGLIQQKYGTKSEEVKQKLSDMFSRFEDKASEVKDKASETAGKVADNVKKDLKH
ncbi:MAG: CsbD family protein [Bdellovibrio sp. CG10_big_fil_rev_8_21_14_0_10_47_8]|nr:MAG: CsbD family protein [Bdellovibrio sp. CG10_big_fil_rev_8_21_14_0_10_47_8]